MARRKRQYNRPILADWKYSSVDVAKFINYIMERGKKNAAEKIVYGAFDILKEKTQKEPVEVFETAFKNATPILEVKSRRVGGATYQVPMEVRGERKFALGSRWIIGAARARVGKPMAEKLAMELLDAANNVGTAVKKRADVHRMAEANRAFAHFMKR